MSAEDEVPPVSQQQVERRRIAVMSLEAGKSVLPDVIRAVGDLADWPFAFDVAAPTRAAIVRAKEVVLAVGPLAPGGPEKVMVAPSIKGGAVVTFILPQKRDVTVASLNNQSSVVVLGEGWMGELRVMEMTHPEAVQHARAFCRRDE